MSAIYGVVQFDDTALAPVTRETLAPVAAAMAVWGPDGHGQWCGVGAGLGHLMLHVTPESIYERLPAGIRVAQHLVITADARIDNRDEIFGALGVADSGRAQTPDSSLILLAYERWGPDCVKRLLGDFAFAIWDSRQRKLFCARDVFGCMPFVYCQDGKRFVFASDVKGVLALVESPRLNEPLLAAYLQMNTYNAEKRYTFFEGIVKLLPAHTMTVTAEGVQTSRYWAPGDAPEVRLASDADYTERMRELFEQSVACRLRSAFPIGSHLSGGLDSTCVSITASRMMRGRGEELSAYSWSPAPVPGAEFDPDSEHIRIEAVCQAEGLMCQYLPVTTENYFDLFRTDFTVNPTEMLAHESNVQKRAVEQGVRVLLSGWGGDEAVSGRCRSAKRIDGRLRDAAITRLPDYLYSLLVPTLWLEYKNPCIQPAFAALHRRAVMNLRGPAFRPQPNDRSTICHLLEYGHVTKRLEHWAISGARHRLVYRYPMLDRKLVEFILGVPARQTVFRPAVAGILPATVDWGRRKKESIGALALKQVAFAACREWADRPETDFAQVTATRFVDPDKILMAVRKKTSSGRLEQLGGVKEAFECYSIPDRCTTNK